MFTNILNESVSGRQFSHANVIQITLCISPWCYSLSGDPKMLYWILFTLTPAALDTWRFLCDLVYIGIRMNFQM